MKTTEWLFPWKAKAGILDLLDRVQIRDEAIESLKGQLHSAATALMECRKSETEWRSAAEDHERALQEAVERVNQLSQRPDNGVLVALNAKLADATEQLASCRRELTERNETVSALKDLHEATVKANETTRNRAAMADASSARVDFLERQLAESNLAVRKLREWITTTHRLDKPAAANTIKQMLQEAQKPKATKP